MSAAFFDYVRGRTDQVPPGHDPRGMRVYRHLVYLGAAQMVESSFPNLRPELGEDAWRTLIEAFVRDSQWQSHFYGDVTDAFVEFVARERARPD